jgi:hypothetical protein
MGNDLVGDAAAASRTMVAARGAQEQTSLMGVIYGNSPAYRGDSGAMLVDR